MQANNQPAAPQPAIHQLRYPAPRREPVKTAAGWCSKPWSPEGILKTVRGGGWFGLDHDFEYGAQPFAFDCMLAMEVLRG